MMPGNHADQSRVPESQLPPELERKLQLCEGIVDRMRILQEQVDSELREQQAGGAPEQPYEAAPAIRLAVSSVLRWLLESLKPLRR